MAVRHKKIAVVTGGSSGIGRYTSAALRDKGYLVYEFSRRHIPISGVNHLSVDVTDEEMVTSAIHHIMKAEGKIDTIVNCAGFGISGAVEFTTTEQAKSQFDVNFFGTVNVNKAVLPGMHQQGSGHIVNISSVAATAHIPFQTFYSASKAAVSSYSYALANEVRPYGRRISRSVSRMEHDEQNGMAPEDIGSFIADIVTKKKPSVLCVAGTQYKFLSLLCKILPTALRQKIVGMIYG